MSKNFLITILAITIILFLLERNCNSSSGEPVKSDTTYITVRDSLIYIPEPDTIIQYVSKPKPVNVIQSDTVEYLLFPDIEIDTLALLKDYYSKVVYNDTVSVDLGRIIINDTLTKNRILSRKVLTDFKLPVVTNTITQKSRVSFGIQSGIGYNGEKFVPYIGLGVQFNIIHFKK